MSPVMYPTRNDCTHLCLEALKRGSVFDERRSLTSALRGGHSSSIQVKLDQPHVVEITQSEAPLEEELIGAGAESEETESSDTEPDADAQPRGSGPRGQGPPIQVHRGRKHRNFQDGGGLCSPGQWEPKRRPVCRAPRVVALRAAIMRELHGLGTGKGVDGVKEIFDALEKQSCTGHPFPEDRTASLISYAHELFGKRSEPRMGDRDMKIRIRLVQAVLEDAEDGDHGAADLIAPGVPIGVRHRLPRTPAVYPRRRKWRLSGQEDPEAWRGDGWQKAEWRENYSSATLVADEVEQQLEELVAADKAGRLSEQELRDRWPDAIVASLGALTQAKPDGTIKTRMLYDGTFGAGINPMIRVRDKDRGPATADVRRLLNLQARTGRRTLGITADVKDAHREVPVREQDWRLQVCRARPPPSSCYFFRCGVFGIASAAYWWGRLAACLLRLLHHLGDSSLEGWILLVADDFKLESTSATPEFSLLFYLWALVIMGVPLQWHKSTAGQRLEWVGYAFHLREHSLGLSASRAAWAVAWCTRHATNGGGSLEELREGVGRLGFAVGALVFDAPFQGPLCSYIGVCRSGGYRRYPAFVRLALK